MLPAPLRARLESWVRAMEGAGMPIAEAPALIAQIPCRCPICGARAPAPLEMAEHMQAHGYAYWSWGGYVTTLTCPNCRGEVRVICYALARVGVFTRTGEEAYYLEVAGVCERCRIALAGWVGGARSYLEGLLRRLGIVR